MTILSYSPSHVDPDTLERLTIGPTRQRLLETLVEAVRAEVGRSVHQHHLLIGPRGSGKTHTLTLVAHRLRTDSELGSRTLPLVLAEEEVARHPADLLIKILEKLAAGLEGLDAPGVTAARKETRAVLAALRSEGDDEQALEMAMGGLEAAAAALDRLLVVTVENLHLLLYAGPGLSRRSVEPGQWALRRLLLPARRLLLLAGAPSLFGEVCDRRAPFFDFFRIHHLEELPPEEMLDLIRIRLGLELQGDRLDPAQRTRLGALAEGFDQRAPKLRGLLPLTGGLPRFAHLLFDLLAETDMQRSVDFLSRFLDEQTPYFQARLDPRLVPEAELEILDLLATAAGPQATTEIAAGLRAKAPNTVAIYLKRLQERGLVRQTGTSRRDVRYDVSEPLFRVWRRFRIGRAEREQIALLAELVAALFEPREIYEEWQMLEGMERVTLRSRVLETAWGWQARQAETALINVLSNLNRVEANAITSSADILSLFGDSQAVLEALRHSEQFSITAGDNLARARAVKCQADILFFLGDNQEALDALREAKQLFSNVGDDLGHAHSVTSRAHILFRLGDHKAALTGYKEAQVLFQKVGDEAGLGSCHWGYGLEALAREQWEEGLDHLVTSYRFSRSAGHPLDINLSRRSTWAFFLFAGVRLEPGRFQSLIRKAEPLVREAGDDEAARAALVHFVITALACIGPVPLLDMLPFLESGLPESHRTLLQPIRLAAEIRVGRRSAELPEESEEMRRAVREVLKAAEGATLAGKKAKGKRSFAKRQKVGPRPS